MNLELNKLFDDVFVKKIPLEFWEREQIVNQIIRIRELIGTNEYIKEDEYHAAEDETLVFILNQLLEIYGLKFFTKKNLNQLK